MLSSRGICQICRASIARTLQQRSDPLTQTARKFSQSSFKAPSYLRNQNATAVRPKLLAPTRPQPNTHLSIFASRIKSQANVRFASTTPSPAASSASTSSSVDLAVANPVNNTTGLPADLGNDLASSFAGDHWSIGYLSSQGIDFGWGISTCMSWLFEHIHVFGSLPMGLSIGATIAGMAMLLRVFAFPLLVTAGEQSARIKAINPILEPVTTKMREASAARDSAKVAQARVELREIYRKADIKPSRIFLPMLQIPMGFCYWRVVRNMSDLPVEGMKTGGWLWFKDLSIPDPLTGLPLMMAGAQFLAIKLGGETGVQTTQSKQLRAFMQYGLPAVSYLVVMWAPAAVSLSFFSAAIFAILSGCLIRNASFRRYMNLSPLIKHHASPTSGYKGTITVDARTKASSTTGEAVKTTTPSWTSPYARLKKVTSDAVSGVMPQAKKEREGSKQRRIKDHARAYERKREKEIQSERKLYDELQQRKLREKHF